VHLFREKERWHVEENVASPSRVGQRIWTCPLEPRQTVEGGVEKAFDKGRPLSFVFCRVVFAKEILPQIIGISSETGRRCRYARRFMPDSVKVEIQIVVY
jgi:hypothetical protein